MCALGQRTTPTSMARWQRPTNWSPRPLSWRNGLGGPSLPPTKLERSLDWEDAMSETQQAKRVALLTGAAQGIGAATARLFAERGYSVAALDVLDTGQQVCDEINQAGGDCQFY